MLQRILDTDVSFANATSKAHEDYHHIIGSKPYITTITCCFYLSQAPQSVTNIVERVMKPDNSLLQSLIDDVFGGHDMFYPKPDKSTFHNCTIFMLHDQDQRHRVAIKCFTNGTLHITGVKSLQRAYDIAEMFCSLIEVIEGGCGVGEWYSIQDSSIQMINMHVSLSLEEGQLLNLDMTHDVFSKTNVCMVSYNNERHSGVIVKFLTEDAVCVSILIFDSGNILLCGVKSCNDFIETCRFIMRIVEQYKDNIFFDARSTLTMDVKKKRRGRRQQKGHGQFDYGKYILLK
jgi:TATA-box binding protein (TBP) (component of TFIID and TFIIIB)